MRRAGARCEMSSALLISDGGIGAARARSAADALLDAGAALLLSVGFAGALDAALAPGDVLLADEVGLGKTIEAGLILHRQLLTGRARRVLILVPEPLLHQWLIELLRRFNLRFRLFDEERVARRGCARGRAYQPAQEDPRLRHPTRRRNLAPGWA